MMQPGYEERIGRYSEPLADAFLDVLELPARARVLDVGCGSGAMDAGVSQLVVVLAAIPFRSSGTNLRS
jgi:hypothetical protein